MTKTELLSLAASARASIEALAAGIDALPDDSVPPPPPPAPTTEHEAVMALVPAESATLFVPTGEVRELSGAQSHGGIRVEGTLRPLPGCTLRVETLLVNHGRLEIGTPENPIPLDNPVRIILRGPISDPLELGRGLVLHGEVAIYGEAVTPYVELTADPQAGDTSIQLAAPVVNWRPGHTLLLPGQVLGQDDTATIASIDGSSVQLSAPLQFAHPTLQSEAPVAHLGTRDIIRPLAANTTRAVTIESENPAERGHVMVMSSGQRVIRGVAFKDLGRTDKSRPTGSDNRPGRYSLHFHANGPVNQAAIVGDCVVWGSPGWGAVNHSSNVRLSNHVSFDVLGAHLVGEHGDEAGIFENFLCVKATGSGDIRWDRDPANLGLDVGHAGRAVWLQSGGIELRNGIASGTADVPFFVASGFSVDYPLAALPDPSFLDPANLVEGWYPGQPNTVPSQAVPVRLSGLVSFTTPAPYGLQIWSNNNPRYHTSHGRAADCIFHGGGVFLNYVLGLTLERIVITAPNPAHASSNPYAIDNASLGGWWRWDDLHIEGWPYAARMASRGEQLVNGGYFDCTQNLAIDQSDHLPRNIVIDGLQTYGPRSQGGVVMRPEHYPWSLERLRLGWMSEDQAALFWVNPTPEQALQRHDFPFRITDVVRVGDEYVSYEPFAPDYDLSQLAGLALPEGVRTTAEAAAAGMFVGGRELLTEWSHKPGHAGVFHREAARLK